MRFILILTSLLLASLNVFAQMGVSFGYNASRETTGSTIDGLYAGLFYDLKFSRKVYLQPHLLFTMSGSKFKENENKVIQHANYIEFPIPLSLRFPINEKDHFVLNLGPYIAYGVGGKTEKQDSNYNVSQSFQTFNILKRFDSGIYTSIAYANKNNSNYFFISYKHGLINTNKKPNIIENGHNWSIRIGFNISFNILDGMN